MSTTPETLHEPCVMAGSSLASGAALPQPAVSPVAASGHDEREAVVVKLLPLVRRVASEMRAHLPAHVEVDDLAGAGVLGLLDAVRKFDPRKHVKLETYARHRIRGAVLDSLRSLDTASRDMRRKNKKAERVHRELEARAGRPVDDAEMAGALGISLKEWYRTVHELQTTGLDWLRSAQIPDTAPPDVQDLPAENAENPVDLCYRREQRELLARALEQLSERERTVVSLYYEQDVTMKEIGNQLGIDESRVSQLHSAAVAHLRSHVQTMLRTPRDDRRSSCGRRKTASASLRP
jgi:RNA polymerase sigma factor FliA